MSHAWNAVDKAVGLKVKLTTVDGGEVEGYLFTFDSKLNTLVIQEVVSTDPKKYNIRMLKASAVTKVSVLPGDAEESKAVSISRLPLVDWAKIRAKEAQTIDRIKDEHIRSPEGVAIFAALLKTYPCVWDNDDIIVMESIKLSPPYGPDNLSNGGEMLNSEAVRRVRKLLEREHKKLKLKGSESEQVPAQ
uniref:AD domain-containing protein n=2 Tax=Rhodosorus marinus TaxID=101924 RepID=A0A7S3EFR1_9RHOD|mmetsp:Transcript_28946/g.112625  ORF Transcript_28946/g.112625 Transcript_28946/m.112625 type:complete len:190 (+) Transcript_28946:297-866(+)|eukprot:CAMPEP_0113966568 /NCGR_PEP_ID=MMETSP0011_2-20120614/8399_1 /TAXON_ID=101924 /ORGANISM="Rhodosorus marinus" /LENGTH=189 /DNA_ID=CAMNT_0000979259 /DNA_START=250 /DNA_END=819 /DNA_ORIENTATION=- /assembly_acc=CAM_ASM_000156